MKNKERKLFIEYKCIYFLARKNFNKVDLEIENIKNLYKYSYNYINFLKNYYNKNYKESLNNFYFLLKNFRVKNNEIKWCIRNIINYFKNNEDFKIIINNIFEELNKNYSWIKI